MRQVSFVAALLVALASPIASCGGGGGPTGVDLTRPVHVDVNASAARNLSEYNLFSWDPDAGFAWNDRVVPYDMNTPLFSDYALKQRAIYLPEGVSAAYDPELAFTMPVGAVVLKNFYFPADFRAPTEHLRMVETRLLVRTASGWDMRVYIWDAAQRDAVYSPSGENRRIAFVDVNGDDQVANYLIPQRNQCASCHAQNDPDTSVSQIHLIGIKARHINRVYDYGGTVAMANQLEHLSTLGMLTGLPPIASVPAAYDFRPIEAGGVAAIPPAEIDSAARSYLDINCAHCHNPNGVQGVTSQLFLNHDNVDLFRLGYCKRPGSAGLGTGGRTFDIVPADPEESILHFRIETETVGAIMPLLGRSLRHQRGEELVHAWIAAMPAQTCN